MAVTQTPAGIVVIGFESHTLSGYCPRGVTITHEAEITPVFCGGSLKSMLSAYPRHEIQFDAVILAAGSLTPTAKGAVVTINSIPYLCTGCTVSVGDKESTYSFRGRKDDDLSSYT